MKIGCNFNTSFEHSEPGDFLKSQWQKKEKSVVYLIYRWIIAGFYTFSVIASIITSAMRVELPFYLIYLTHWNLIFTMLTMLLHAYLVTLHQTDRLKVGDKMTRDLKLYWFLSTTSNVYAFLVSLIYWNILYKTELNVIDMNNIIVHATNSLVLIIDMAGVKHIGRLGLFVYPLCCGLIFLFFTWLYPFLGGKNRRGHNYIYPILDWKKKPITAIYAGIGVTIGGVIVHCSVIIVHKIRAYIHKKCVATKYEITEFSTLTC
ncbi:CLUMA_CG019547, isoform A [Clunio marinus]|uniref:CLUMA_CG019547, isoform A n=1 Tax=Clunio marinus TaxID=568069 RepID=A0A1J1J1K4_9DIPT|nr:CLUMA_CG019547, isoform A [Clunio marinus]